MWFELRAEAKGVLTPSEVKRIRERLELTQKDAGLILGGGIRAFYRYEAGSIVPSLAVTNLLRLLDANPSQLDLLRPQVAAG